MDAPIIQHVCPMLFSIRILLRAKGTHDEISYASLFSPQGRDASEDN